MAKISVIIPARLESTRLPGKILQEIGDMPMLQHVWCQTQRMQCANEVYIATDSEKVQKLAQNWGAQVLMTPENCQSGTERIAHVLDQLTGEFIINVQGDEPFIPPTLLDQLAKRLKTKDCDLVTPVRRIETNEALFDPNLVKVVLANDGRALYFSRSPIPYARNTAKNEWISAGDYWAHIGVYGYKRTLLEGYSSLAASHLEKIENLEQLRYLQNGYSIQTIQTDYHPIGVDTAEDLENARKHYKYYIQNS